MPQETFGWISSRRRTAMLGAGWVLVVLALGTIVAGVVTGNLVLLVVGLAAGTAAWALSAALPEPAPAPHRAERKRREALRRFSDHPVYFSKSARPER